MVGKPSIPAEMMSDSADVYTADLATGRYTVLAQADLPCRLAVIRPGTTSAPERAELAAMRRLYWGPDYAMPDYAQVEINSERWNVVQGTVTAPTWLDGTVINYQCDVVRAE
jgi:hypothetical protein